MSERYTPADLFVFKRALDAYERAIIRRHMPDTAFIMRARQIASARIALLDEMLEREGELIAYGEQLRDIKDKAQSWIEEIEKRRADRGAA
jgi:hypothetical protein